MKYTPELIAKLRSPSTILFPETEHEYLMCALDEIERLQSAERWIPVSERLPDTYTPVWVSCKYNAKTKPIQMKATYIAPKSVLAEDFLSDELDCDGVQEYDEENDCYWVKEGWWEESEEAEYNYQISGIVTHWRPLPQSPSESQVDK